MLYFRFDLCKMPLVSTCPNRVVIPDSTSPDYDKNRVRQYTADSEGTQTATAHGVVMWWCLDMDTSGRITLSTAPKWLHPHGRNAQVSGYMYATV